MKTRPAWSYLGGGAFAAGAAALLVATVLEYFVRTGETQRDGLFWSFVVFFVINIVLYVVAMLALAFGDGGIAGDSVLGRAGLIAFGLGWAIAQSIYLPGYFVDTSGIAWLMWVVTVIMYLGAIAAAIMIVRRRVAYGPARWSLIVGLAVGLVASSVVANTSDQFPVTIAYVISTLAQLLVGVSFVARRASTRPA